MIGTERSLNKRDCRTDDDGNFTAAFGSCIFRVGFGRESSELPASVPFGDTGCLPLNQPLPAPESVEMHLQEQAKTMGLSDVQHPFLLNQSAGNWPLEQWGTVGSHSERHTNLLGMNKRQRRFDYGKQWLPNY